MLSVAACGGGADDNLATPDARVDAALEDAAVEVDAVIDAEVERCPEPTSGPTMHTGDVAQGEVWTAAGSPHIVTGNVNVRGGVNLVVEPCAVVQMKRGTSIHIAYPSTPNTGSVSAEGTAARPIRIEAADAEAWDRIYVVAPGTLRLAHVTLSGGGGESPEGETIAVHGDGMLPSDALLHVDHVTIERSTGTGISLRTLAKFTAESQNLTIRNSGSTTFPHPVMLTEHALSSLPSGVYTGNRDDRILVQQDPIGGIREDSTIRDRGVPYLLGRYEGANGGLRVEATEGKPAVKLTIEAGVRLEFARGSALEIGHYTGDSAATASIDARGTADKPIVFTSALATKQPGDWRGLWFGARPSADNRLEHVQIEYTGAHCGCIFLTCDADLANYSGALIFSQPPASMFMQNSVIRYGSANGVVQGYTGVGFDWTAGNTITDMTGCKQTRPWNPDEQVCPNPRPLCVR